MGRGSTAWPVLTLWPRNQAEIRIWLLRISWYWVRHRQPRNVFWMRVASSDTRSWRCRSRSKSWGQPWQALGH